MMEAIYKSRLYQTVSATKTDYWNDSCSVEELTYAVEHGAVGATSNPTIVLQVIQKEMDLWKDRIIEMIQQNPTGSEEEITWQVIEEVTVKGADLLLPVFERTGGKKGRLSIQTNPVYYRDWERLAAQAVHFDSLAPNLQVKLPVTKAGIKAIEETTYRGININATVCFSVPQALAVAEAVERGLDRREAAGMHTDMMSPVCTIMIGRLDDWMQVLMKRDGIRVDPETVPWAGIAVLKRAYALFQQKGYRCRLLAAAYRHLGHWSELIGGDIVLTIPFEWQKKINASGIEVRETFFDPVDPAILDALNHSFPDFRKAYEPEGMTPAEFDTFGPTVRTLRGFIGSYRDLQALIRNMMLPNPDVRE